MEDIRNELVASSCFTANEVACMSDHRAQREYLTIYGRLEDYERE